MGCSGSKAAPVANNEPSNEAMAECNMKPTLYWSRISPPSSATLTVAKMCCDGKFDLKELDLMKGEHKQEDYLKIQPEGKVPFLRNEQQNFCLGESRAIMALLARKSGCMQLVGGEDILGQAKFNQAIMYEAGTVNAKIGEIVNPIIFAGATPDPEEIKGKLMPIMMHISKQLEACKFVAGECMTIADIMLVFDLAMLVKGMGDGEVEKIHKVPNFKRWLDDMKCCDKFMNAVKCISEKYPGGHCDCVLKVLC